MASQLLGIKTRFTNDLGSPLVGGQVYTYFAGTSTNQDTYSDAALTVPNTNPVVLDDTGSADIFLKGAYRIRVFDKSGRFIEEQDNVTQAASQGDAAEITNKITNIEGEITELNKVKFDTGITAVAKFGGVERKQDKINAETVSVEDFGANTANADNTTQINNALQYAFDNRANLYFPNGTYATANSLPLLRSVKCSGSGAIKRGDDVFYITPDETQSNTIYFNSLGTGDGLSASDAINIGYLVVLLRNLGSRTLDGYWTLKLTAGIYRNKGLRISNIPPFRNILKVEGELDVSGNHATIWDGATSTEAYAWRMDLICVPQRIDFKDIKFTNWTADATNAGAIVAWGGHTINTYNIHTDNCPIGVWVSRNSQYRSYGDTFNNCATWAIGCQYSSSVVVGTSTQRTKITNSFRGLHVGRASIGHNDYVDYEGNDYDLQITQNSRVAHVNPTFKDWKVVSQFALNGAINEGINACTFDPASITDTTPVFMTENAAVIDVNKGQGLELLHQSYVPHLVSPITGTTKKLLNEVDGFGPWLRLPDFTFYQGTRFHAKYQARLQGSNTTAGSKFIISSIGSAASSELISFDLPSGGWSGMLIVCFELSAGGTLYAYGALTSTAGVSYKANTTTVTNVDLFRGKTGADVLFRSYIQLASASDSLTPISQKTWLTL